MPVYTRTTYKELAVLDPNPGGAGGDIIQDNFKQIADWHVVDAAVSGIVTGLQADIAELGGAVDLTEISGDISGLQADFNTLSGTVTGLESDMTAVETGKIPYNGANATVNLGAQNLATTGTLSANNIGAGVSTPTARLHLAAGGTAAGSAPLRFTPSTSILISPVAGAVEYVNSTIAIRGGDGLLLSGVAGTTQVAGSGSRLMWISAKRAFRAGAVNSTQWNDINIGDCTFGLGYSTKAIGYTSGAMGYHTHAGGYGAFAGGYNIAGNTTNLIAGDGTAGSGFGQFAFGYASAGNTLKAEGTGSIAMGQDVNALNANDGVGPIAGLQITSQGSGYSTNLEITGYYINNGGSDYQVSDSIYIVDSGGYAYFTVDSVDGSGGITALTMTAAGTGFQSNTGYNTGGGSGNDAVIQVTSVLDTIVLTITTGDGNATVNAIVDNAMGYITSINLTDAGTGYSVGAGQATSGGGNDDCTIEVLSISDVSNGNVLAFGRGFSVTTTDSFNVGFGARQLQVTNTKVNVTSLPTGTLASPPAGIDVGDMWLDTTDSAQYPVVRYRAS